VPLVELDALELFEDALPFVEFEALLEFVEFEALLELEVELVLLSPGGADPVPDPPPPMTGPVPLVVLDALELLDVLVEFVTTGGV